MDSLNEIKNKTGEMYNLLDKLEIKGINNMVIVYSIAAIVQNQMIPTIEKLEKEIEELKNKNGREEST